MHTGAARGPTTNWEKIVLGRSCRKVEFDLKSESAAAPCDNVPLASPKLDPGSVSHVNNSTRELI